MTANSGTWEPDFSARASSYIPNFTFDANKSSDFSLAVCQSLALSLNQKNSSSGSSTSISDCIAIINSNLSLLTIKNLLCCVLPGSESQKSLLCAIFNNGLKVALAQKSSDSSTKVTLAVPTNTSLQASRPNSPITVDVTDVPETALARGWARVLGLEQGVDDLADHGRTIGYEVLTGLGRRYPRHYAT